MLNIESGKIQSFKDLHSWQEGHKLVILIYKETDAFPKSELFSLTSQLRRASVSLTSNIAEGFSRNTYKEKVQFYSIAMGSLTEIENQLIIAKDLKYLTEKSFNILNEQIIIVSKLLRGLISKSKSFYS